MYHSMLATLQCCAANSKIPLKTTLNKIRQDRSSGFCTRLTLSLSAECPFNIAFALQKMSFGARNI